MFRLTYASYATTLPLNAPHGATAKGQGREHEMTTTTKTTQPMTRGQLMIALVEKRLEDIETLRRAKIAGAKTNLEQLMAQGVVITCDDAFDNAMRDQGVTERAKAAGVSFQLMDEALDFCRLADGIIDGFRRIARQGESDEERAARFRAAEAALPETFQKGKKKACRHNGTQRERGWMACGSIGPAIVPTIRHVCCRCGAELLFPDRPGTVSQAAKEARHLVELLSNDEPTDNVVSLSRS